MRLDFLIRRRGLDPAAETALHALRDLMHSEVTDVERGTLWRFDLDDVDAAHEVQRQLERAACRAGRYVNTNRDACHWLEPRADGAAAETATYRVALWVTHGDGSDAVARAYFQKSVDVALRAVRRGVFWALTITARDADAARNRVLDLAVTRTRTQGLLANPHHERVEVLQVACHDHTVEVR